MCVKPYSSYVQTMGEKRKKEIYDICVKFGEDIVREFRVGTHSDRNDTDVIIVEDDPYYFLQQGPYKSKSERSTASVKHDEDKFLAGLAPSYLRFDYQGRVIRLDTFSKVATCADLQIRPLRIICGSLVRCSRQQARLVYMQPPVG